MPEIALINLLSEQTIPNYLAIRETRPSRVLALVTDQYRNQPERFQSLSGIPHTAIPIAPYDLQCTTQALYAAINALPDNFTVLLNFTGGTKVMAVASVLAAMQPPARPMALLYVNTDKGCCDHYRWDPSGLTFTESRPFGSTLSFRDVVELAGESIQAVGADHADVSRRKSLSEWMFANRGHLAAHYDDCFEGSGRSRKVRPQHKFVVMDRARTVASIEWIGANLCVAPAGKRAFVPQLHNPGAYVAGGWWEEFCLLRMIEARKFDEVFGNVVLHLGAETRMRRAQNGRTLGAKNEIDIAVAHHGRAALIECKAGDWDADHLYKLHAITKHICGTFGAAFLVTAKNGVVLRREAPELMEKAADLDIRVVAGDEVKSLPGIVAQAIRSSP